MKQSIFLNVDMQRLLSRSNTTANTNSKVLIRRKNISINARTEGIDSAHEQDCKKVKKMSYSADKPKQFEGKEQESINKSNHWVFQKKRKPHVTDSGETGLTRALVLKNTTISSHHIASIQTQSYKKNQKNRHNTFRTNKTETSAMNNQASQKQLSKSSKRQPSKINNQHILHWINDVLNINSNTPAEKQFYLSAVRDYTIDPASLTAQKVSNENISRIYRCLYVYSEGFSQFINEICNHSQKLSANLWKVYTILVEHCSRGVVETILSSLIAQNQQIKQNYLIQLEQKQLLIDHNDVINQKKNQKIMKEIKNLTFQNEQLSTEKVFIANELHDAQNAFSEEISLRLLFQQKINHIHYAYREINDKHGLLYRDFKQKEKENQQLTQSNKLLTEQIIGLKQTNWGLQQTAKSLQSDINILRNQLKKAEEELEIFRFKDHSKMLQKQTLVLENIELKHSLDRLQKQHQNTQTMFKLIQQSYHSLQGQYMQVLSDNKRMITAMEKQNQENNFHFRQRVTLSEQMIAFQNDKAYFQKKIKEKDDRIYELKAEITKINETIAIHQEEKQFLKETITQIKSELESATKTIQVHHKTAQQNLTIQNDYKTRAETLEKYSSQRQSLLTNTKQELKKLQELLLKSQKRQEQLSSQLQLLGIQHTNISSLLENTEDKLKKQMRKSKQNQCSLQRVIKQQEEQLQRIREMYESATTDLNNQRFERKTLDISYKHSLTVIDNNLTIKKELKTKIAQLQQRLEEEKLQIKVNQMKYSQIIEKLESENKNVKEKAGAIEIELNKKKEHIHRMYYQDIRSLLIAKEERVIELQQLLQALQNQYFDSKNKLSSILKTKQMEIINLQGKIKEKAAMYALDIEYQKKKHGSLSKRIEDLEMEVVTQQAKAKAPMSQFRQKEKKYLDAITQKNERINTLLRDIQQLKDRYYLLSKKVSEQEIHIHDQKGKINRLQGQYKQYKQYKYSNEKYQIEEKSEEIGSLQFEQLIKSQILQGNYELNNGSLKNTFKRNDTSQNIDNLDQEITISILSKQSKQIKSFRNSATQIEENDKQITIQRQPNKEKTKKSREEKKINISNKMKNASIYYSK